MKVYCQLLEMSTGYIEGAVPPKFSDANRKPIDMLGSCARIVLDGRKSLSSLVIDCDEIVGKKMRKPVGYKIIRAGDFRSDGNEIYRKVY